MKKAFTLVELLVVVVVIVTLLAITFRIAGVASDASYRNTTIARMQRIENALSGYYAAFGSYPPVDLHASRNIYLKVDPATGNQTDSEESKLNWASVRAACLAQPFAARFPFDENLKPYIEAVSKIVVERANSSDSKDEAFHARQSILGGGFDSLTNPNSVDKWDSESSWQVVKIFQFGVMSFLMPRYRFMLEGLDLENLDKCKQWSDSNRLSANPNNGRMFQSWKVQLEKNSLVERMPSQSVCARWMPNFEGIVSGGGPSEFFGVKVGTGGCSVSADDPNIEVFTSGSFRYVLDSMTIKDGWSQEFYYYSPAPFQSYRLWSAGPNGKTFPPWVSLDSSVFKSESDKKTASSWMADDIMFMSN